MLFPRQQGKTGLFQDFFQVLPPCLSQRAFLKPRLELGFKAVKPTPAGLHWDRYFSGSFSWQPLFSTIWPGSFLALFFPQLRVFNNFSASFLGSFGFVFGTFHFVFNNISGSFSKKGILFVPQFGCQIHQRILF
ncbi:MAG TPA: hypothetical protein VNM47_08310, partial [Terriglobia bacterium]|nr:hypothetical protein [Terriglobia bacterium]